MNFALLLLGAYMSLLNSIPGHQPLARSEPHWQHNPSLTRDIIVRHQWTNWKEAHNKSYHEALDPIKRLVFESNAKTVIEFNDKIAEELGFSLELNHLADMSHFEMSELNGFRSSYKPDLFLQRNRPRAQAFLDQILADNSTEVPEEVDWRKTPGRVSDVKNQGQCGSCWAFASTGLLEGQEAGRKEELADGKLVELSEQNLVDCVKKDNGCNGGFMADALDFIKDEGGIDDEQSYPYEARTKKCRFRKDKVAFTDSGSAILPTGDEQKLKEVVAKYGPVAVAIDASSIWFQLYRKGVYVNKRCKKREEQLDHGVLVVGYGTDPKKGDYWIVKNSWGARYGEKGYIRMARNKNNMCGIATVATIATF